MSCISWKISVKLSVLMSSMSGEAVVLRGVESFSGLKRQGWPPSKDQITQMLRRGFRPQHMWTPLHLPRNREKIVRNLIMCSYFWPFKILETSMIYHYSPTSKIKSTTFPHYRTKTGNPTKFPTNFNQCALHLKIKGKFLMFRFYIIINSGWNDFWKIWCRTSSPCTCVFNRSSTLTRLDCTRRH